MDNTRAFIRPLTKMVTNNSTHLLIIHRHLRTMNGYSDASQQPTLPVKTELRQDSSPSVTRRVSCRGGAGAGSPALNPHTRRGSATRAPLSFWCSLTHSQKPNSFPERYASGNSLTSKWSNVNIIALGNCFRETWM